MTHSESVLKYTKKRKSTDLRFWMKCIFMNRRTQARAKSIDFTIEFDDVPYNERCPMLDIPYTYGSNRNLSPSLDRIDTTKGYVKGNVRWISNRANRWKNNMTYEDMQLMLDNFYKTC